MSEYEDKVVHTKELCHGDQIGFTEKGLTTWFTVKDVGNLPSGDVVVYFGDDGQHLFAKATSWDIRRRPVRRSDAQKLAAIEVAVRGDNQYGYNLSNTIRKILES